MAFSPENLDHLEQPGHSKKKKSDENGCKGCKCRKSECLKLYCNCFAAGIYCTDPCSCQGCLNTAEYEDTILEKRKQIQSRNRFAFLPKIVPQSNVLPSNSNNNTEDADVVTLSMARHRKGCNCKKSMCMKKYCECYRANVGCSNECRCEGCKNEYGTKGCYVAKDDHALSKERVENNGLSNMDIMDRSSPCSSVANVRQPLDSDCNILSEVEYLPATTSHFNYPWQNMLTMENESHNTNMPSNQVGPAPRPIIRPLEQGLVLQPQVHIPAQQLLSQNIQDIAPQSNLLPSPISSLAQTHSQNTGQNNYMFPSSEGQSSFLRSLIQHPNYNVQHSAHVMLQQQQNSVVHQQQTPMAVLGTAQRQQHQLMGPPSDDATNIQVNGHLLQPPNNVSEIQQANRLFLQQNNLTDLFNQFLPYFF